MAEYELHDDLLSLDRWELMCVATTSTHIYFYTMSTIDICNSSSCNEQQMSIMGISVEHRIIYGILQKSGTRIRDLEHDVAPVSRVAGPRSRDGLQDARGWPRSVGNLILHYS